MPGWTQAAALCAQLFLQQQETQSVYNRFAYESRGMPMAAVNAAPPAMTARRAQFRYARACGR